MKSFVRPGRCVRMSLRAAFLLGALSQAALVHAQAPPFDVATAVSTEVDPVERTFEITQQGQYQLTLTDLGGLLPQPDRAPLASGHVLITRGTSVVTSVSTTTEPGSDVDNVLFDAVPGTYKVHVVGKPGTSDRSGPVTVRVAQVGAATQVLDMGTALSPPQRLQAGVVTYQVDIDVPLAGDYDLSVTDLAFPRAVETAGAFLVRPSESTRAGCVSIPAVPIACPSASTVTLEQARYTLVIAGAIPASSDAGVFNVKLRQVGGALIFNRSIELGQVRRLSAADFQLDAGNHSLRFTDLAFPAALQQGSAIATIEGQTAALANGTTPEATFAVASNDSPVDVFGYGQPVAAENAGSYFVDVRPNGGAAVLSSVQAAGLGTTSAFIFSGDVTAAGAYRARLGDFAFPVALGAARMAVVQNGSVLASTGATATGPTWSLDVPNIAVGKVTLVAFARSGAPGGGASQSGGTFGVELAPAGGGAFVIDATQGVGALLSIRKVPIATAGKYDMAVSDLNFPAPFSDLMAVVSRGATRVGTLLVGSGSGAPQGGTARLLDIDAAAGDYTITLIAQPGTTQGAAAYGISFAAAASPPTVTLTASPSAVASGGSTTLTWTSQGAASCTASSNPSGTWTGGKALSGSEAITPITGAISFTLRCVGSTGRSTEQSVSVTVQAPASNGGGGGGGGALGGFFVAMLLAAGAARSAQRLRRRAAFTA